MDVKSVKVKLQGPTLLQIQGATIEVNPSPQRSWVLPCQIFIYKPGIWRCFKLSSRLHAHFFDPNKTEDSFWSWNSSSDQLFKVLTNELCELLLLDPLILTTFEGRELMSNSRFLGLTYKPVGCFKDRFHPRAMPMLLKNFRGSIDWNNLSQIVKKCADEALNRRE